MVTSSGGTSTVYSAPYNTFETSGCCGNQRVVLLDKRSGHGQHLVYQDPSKHDGLLRDNYTVSYSIYNASEEPAELACQNDAYMAQPGDCADGGDDTYGADALNISSANQSFMGYGHDEFDEYDHYRFWMPSNYLVTICVEFPEHNDVDVVLHYKNLHLDVHRGLEYYDNPACIYSNWRTPTSSWLEVRTDTGMGTTRSPWILRRAWSPEQTR